MNTQAWHNYFTGPTSFGNIISRGWWLYRSHFGFINRVSLYLVLIILILSINTKSADMGGYSLIPWYFFKNPDTLLISLVFVPTLFNLVYIKVFNNILFNNVVDFKTIISFIRQKFALFIKFSLFFLFEMSVFIIFDILAFIAIGLGFYLIMDTIDKAITYSSTTETFFIVFFLFCLILYITLFILIFSLQLFLALNQLVCSLIEEIPIKFSIIRSFEITFYNFSRTISFVLTIFTMCYSLFFLIHSTLYSALYLIFSIILYLVTTIYKPILLADHYNNFVFSMIDQVTMAITIAFIWPFIISSLLMFYYDLKMRFEGLDILFMLRDFKREHSDNIITTGQTAP